MCLDTNVLGHKRVWAQTCVGTNLYGHKRVRAQPCVGTNVSGHNHVGSSMYGHKRTCGLCWKRNGRENKGKNIGRTYTVPHELS